MRHALITTLAITLQATCALAAVPLRFAADVRAPAAHQASAYRGETLEIQARLTDGGRPLAVAPGAAASMLWQTNGMGQAWWSAPATVATNGVVSATWSPTNDCGAAAYRIFLGVSDGGRNWRANLLLRMLDSPGATPNELEPPITHIDFARTAVDNAPWLIAESDPLYTQWARTNTLAQAIAGKAPTNHTHKAADISNARWISSESDPLFGQWASEHWINDNMVDWASDAWYAQTLGDAFGEPRYSAYDICDATNALTQAIAGKAPMSHTHAASDITNAPWISGESDPTVPAWAKASRPPVSTLEPATNYTDEVAADLASAWSSDATLLSMLLQGSNVVAEVTNYNSRARSPSLRLLQLNESNEYETVWSELENLSAVERAASNQTEAAAAAAIGVATNYAAPRAWGHTTSALGAEAPDGWTWISTPNLAIGGGLEFEKHITSGGAIWILRNNGMVAQFDATTNNAAYLEIASIDGEPVLRIERTDAQLLGVNTASVSVEGDTLVCGIDVVSSEHPLARVRASLTQGEWAREEDDIPASLATVQWSGEPGAWVCRITNNTGGNSLFATMAYLQEGSIKIVPAAPLDASAGILCTDGVHRVRPVYSGGAVTWEVFQ